MKKFIILFISVSLCAVNSYAQQGRNKRVYHERGNACDSAGNWNRKSPRGSCDDACENSAGKINSGSSGNDSLNSSDPEKESAGNAQTQDFEEFSAYSSENNSTVNPGDAGGPKNIPWILVALGATVAAGIFVRFQATRKFRGAFIVLSVVIFGFYLGGCPCPVSGMQNVILAGMGADKSWTRVIWFLGLIPVTYFFGKVWCGWVCHLGGLQEIIFRQGKLNVLKSERSARILKWVRAFFLVALITQVLITNSNLFREIDPFKAAFNLYPANLITWILLGLLLLSSIFIYRPFCRSVCPVGLVLGWVSKIPGASLLQAGGACHSCSLCQQVCHAGAVSRDDVVRIDNEDCLRCGQCLEACRKNRLKFSIRSLKRPVAAGQPVPSV